MLAHSALEPMLDPQPERFEVMILPAAENRLLQSGQCLVAHRHVKRSDRGLSIVGIGEVRAANPYGPRHRQSANTELYRLLGGL